MTTGADTLYDALTYALEKTGGAIAPVAVVNATGLEPETFEKQSGNACNKLQNTLNGVFNTLLVRATRQNDETLGLVALAAIHADTGAHILVAQENIHGAPGLEKMLRRAFPNLQTLSKFKCRIMVLEAADANRDLLQTWTTKAAVQKVKHNRGEFWSAPGIFSWDRPDAGSLLLLANLPARLDGAGADLGCGNGLLSGALGKKDGVTALYCLDADDKAVTCCKLNLEDRKTAIPFQVLWRDATEDQPDIPKLDWVVMNPPFHTQLHESRELGQKFCESALKMLRPGGELYLVANRHMPYEAILEKGSASVNLLADTDGFKVIRAIAK
jgi:16S rRNA (guanine1207-N2)-methyltransferase